MICLRRIISGGQTGVDRGALEAAAYLGLQRGGMAPAGWRSEDGVIPEWYRSEMMQSASTNYEVRTQANIEASGGTLIIARELPLTGGTAMTHNMCKRYMYKYRVALLEDLDDAFIRWVRNIHTLNVAGPRESKAPGIQKQTRDALISVLAPVLPAVDVFGWDPP